MESKLNVVKFKDFITLKRGYDLPTRKRKTGNVPVLSSSGISGNHNEYKVDGPGVITGRSGLIGSVYYIRKEFWPLNTTLYVTDFKGNNPLYVYYKLKTINLKNFATGSSVPTLNRNHLDSIDVNIHDKEKQKKQIFILEKIDKKINLNRQIIANLEELSQILFKRWFIDFEFPNEEGVPYKSSGGEMIDSELGKIPKGWIVKSLDEIANYINGLAMQKYPSNKEESLPIVKIKELKNGFTDENSNRCTTEIPEKAKIDNGDIIFSWSATLLVKMWAGGKAGLNQHLFKVTSETFPKWFYYLWTKRYIEYFINIANDKATTMGHINRKHLSHAKIVLPTQLQLENFDKIFHNLLEKQLNTEEEIKRLIELRDTLLPKLMSGEIEIPDDVEVNTDELSI